MGGYFGKPSSCLFAQIEGHTLTTYLYNDGSNVRERTDRDKMEGEGL